MTIDEGTIDRVDCSLNMGFCSPGRARKEVHCNRSKGYVSLPNNQPLIRIPVARRWMLLLSPKAGTPTRPGQSPATEPGRNLTKGVSATWSRLGRTEQKTDREKTRRNLSSLPGRKPHARPPCQFRKINWEVLVRTYPNITAAMTSSQRQGGQHPRNQEPTQSPE